MSKFAIAIVAAAGLAGAAFGQTPATSANYEIQLVPAASSGLTSAGGSTADTTIRFVVQARATTPAGTTNYGINRWSTGSITGPAGSVVTRASSSSATAFGRFRPTGNGGAQNFARFQAAGIFSGSTNTDATSGSTPSNNSTPGNAGNVNGVVSGNSITSIDAYRGFAWTALTAPLDENGDPTFAPGDALSNPWGGASVPNSIGGPNTSGTPGAWQNLYAFTVSGLGLGSQTITLGGALNIASSISFQAGSWTFNQLSAVTFVSTLAGSTYNFTVIPTPGAAALLGLGGLAAARRRR